MIFMFVTGVLLALGFGFTGGIVFAKMERSFFTKKFREELKQISLAEQARIEAMQAADKAHVEKLKKEINDILMNSLEVVPPPPREDFN